MTKRGVGVLARTAVTGLLALSFAGANPAPPSAAQSPSAPGDPVAGKKIFKTHCAVCHFAEASISRVGPGMKGLFKLNKLPLSGLPLTEKNVRQRIEEGNADPSKPLMPAYRDILSAKEMDDLLAYLKIL